MGGRLVENAADDIQRLNESRPGGQDPDGDNSRLALPNAETA